MRHGKETAVVWFNGPSVRQFLDIPRQPLEIGCNFIEQHRAVDHVCAYDRPVIQRLDSEGLNPNVTYWTRRNYQNQSWNTVASNVSHGEWRHHTGFCSGTLALTLAIQFGCRKINLLGLDWQRTNHSIYDEQYPWRSFPPTKHNTHKLRFLRHVSEITQLNVIHDQPRDFGFPLLWTSAKEFMDTI
jgi:hypothetical protein